MIERDFDVAFVAALAQREKQAQQHYRPLIGIHKWFARRPGTLFRALLLSEFVPGPLAETFYRGHRLDGLTVADPFMGGGTCVMEANRLGCEVVAGDINPMAWWIVRQELASLDLEAYRDAARTLRRRLEKRVGALYRTRCTICDSHEAEVKSFLWVKTLVCEGCGGAVDLFPSYLVAADGRHPGNVLVCAECAALTETTFRSDPGPCSRCGLALRLEGPARRNRCTCRRCGTLNRYPSARAGLRRTG